MQGDDGSFLFGVGERVALILVRIDDRLIHGQVILGWARTLHPDRIVLVDDAVSSNGVQKQLYEAAVPSEFSVSILGIDEAVQFLSEGEVKTEKILLIVESPRNAFALHNKGVDLKSINVGGLHYAEGKRGLLPYVFIDNQDVGFFRKLMAQGVEVECRDVPTAKKINMKDLL